MITLEDLQSAIAECQGKRSPDANTCIKLAAYYTIMQNLYGTDNAGQSFAAPPENQAGELITFYSDSEFSRAIDGKPMRSAMKVLDELMQAVWILKPSLYNATLRKLEDL